MAKNFEKLDKRFDSKKEKVNVLVKSMEKGNNSEINLWSEIYMYMHNIMHRYTSYS